MTKEKRNTIIRFSYIGATILVIALIMVFNEDFHNVPEVIAGLSPLWMLGAAGCLVIYWLTDGWLLHDITSYMSPTKMNFGKSFKIGLIGLYYCALTPSASGGQPVQVAYMAREKVKIGTGTCVVLIKFIAYALTCIIFYLVSLAFLNEYYLTNYTAMYWLSFLGFIIMIIAVAIVILSIVNRTWILKLGNGIITLFSEKIKAIKNPDSARENFEKTITDYGEAGKYIIKHKARAVGSLLISLLNIGFLFAITYFIYRGFNLDTESFPMVMMLQSLLYSAINYFPTPGGAGMSESGFYIVMQAFFPDAFVFAAMIIWRIFTYYLILIVGSLIVVIDQFAEMKKKKNLTSEDIISKK